MFENLDQIIEYENWIESEEQARRDEVYKRRLLKQQKIKEAYEEGLIDDEYDY